MRRSLCEVVLFVRLYCAIMFWTYVTLSVCVTHTCNTIFVCLTHVHVTQCDAICVFVTHTCDALCVCVWLTYVTLFVFVTHQSRRFLPLFPPLPADDFLQIIVFFICTLHNFPICIIFILHFANFYQKLKDQDRARASLGGFSLFFCCRPFKRLKTWKNFMRTLW